VLGQLEDVLMLSALAVSMNAQVLTQHVGGLGRVDQAVAAAWTWPSITSVSTRFLGQPSDTK